MSFPISRSTLQLTHHAALKIIQGCLECAEEIECRPVHIVVASCSGQIIASLAMDNAYFLSAETARNKALTAASHRRETTMLPADIAKELAVASGGKITAMAGGMPIWEGEECIGGVGIGGADDAEDIMIALAGINAIGL